jgi:hypothetical protein
MLVRDVIFLAVGLNNDHIHAIYTGLEQPYLVRQGDVSNAACLVEYVRGCI